jgi:putative phosphoribosyl transferase
MPTRRGSAVPVFADRRDAGRRLAEGLMSVRAEKPVIVALPRGGVPVAYEVATALGAPLEVLAVRKLGAPANPELGIGAVAEDGTAVIDSATVVALGVGQEQLAAILAHETGELRRRVSLYRGDRPPPDLQGRTVVVIDDGIATGVTDAAALRAIRKMDPGKVILAVPVCAPEAASRLAPEADEVVCMQQPSRLRGVGQWYRDFSQVSDEEVLALLGEAGRHAPAANGLAE